MKKVLVTGAGGGGGNNLINSLKKSSLDLKIYGSNVSPRILAKSNADENYQLPVSTDETYFEKLTELIKKKGIDLIIPNNEREVRAVSNFSGDFPCQRFLPHGDLVNTCQDKYKLYLELKKSFPLAESYSLEKFEDVHDAFEKLKDTGDRFWVRPRIGSGSRGATWVKTPEQAISWISMWIDFRGYKLTDFTISEFLPGRDYAFQSVWKDGRLVVAKMCERLSYFFGANKLSGMSSTPEVARTVRDEPVFEIIKKAIYSITDKPHGNYCLDLKGDQNGVINITEFNIGRFCMITPIFDLTGKLNTAEAYVRSALGEDIYLDDPFDIEENVYLLRDLDTLPTIAREHELDELRFSL